MSTQQEAQERYDKVRKQQTGSMWFAQKSLDDGLDWREHIAEYFFTQGEISGERIALERLAAKSAEGFEDFYNDSEMSDDVTEKHIRADYERTRMPLLAKIEQLEKEDADKGAIIQAMRSDIASLNIKTEEDRRTISGLNLSTGNFRKRISELEEAIESWKKEQNLWAEDTVHYRNKITTLEAQNKKLGDVVLEMVSVVDYLNKACLCDRKTHGFEYGQTHKNMGRPPVGSRWITPKDNAELVLPHADLIKQLKQERGE
jgi:molecular chaperone GrpE (heat shock protein)